MSSSSPSIAMATLPATTTTATSPIPGLGASPSIHTSASTFTSTSTSTSTSPFTSTSRPPPRLLQTRVAVSSLPLQMLLYYHTLFSVTFGLMFLWIFPWKYLNSSDVRTAVISPIVFTLWSIVEIIRIYMGYIGNCKEQVPHLVAFLFLTLFPQVFITLYFMLMQKPLLPMDRILSIIQLILLAVNVLLGGLAFRTIVQNKTARFAVEFGEIAGAAQAQTESTRAILSVPSSSDDDDLRLRTSRHQHTMLRERGGTSAESRLATTLLSSGLSSPSGQLSESEQERAERRARDRALIRQQYKPTRLTAERRQYYQQLESELGSTAGVFDSSPSPHPQGPIRPPVGRRSIEMSRASLPSIRASDLVQEQESTQYDDGMETDTSVGTEDELLRRRRSR